ncbi:MAG TPA: M20/M25/M40 family metallo-hydrolase [Galbitalea sp.]|nr:M20/M25/M40 family metallo-hydrolase [Galbitalea sp.]
MAPVKGGAPELADVVKIARDLIRINTTNYGSGRAEPESAAADYIEGILDALGLRCQRFEAAPGRTNLIARWVGRDVAAPALMLHGHLDVVPADPALWTHGPFDGDIAQGMLWGRGAVDMKNMVAMILATVRELVAEGFQPRGDIVLAFFADEEGGMTLGSDWMAKNQPEQFAGVTHAVSEGGGYSVTVNGKRAYLMNTGEKGVLWLRLRANGVAGHGSLPAVDNAILRLAGAVVRIGELEWPVTISATTGVLLESLRKLSGATADADPMDLAASVGASAPRIRAGLRNVSNVTMFDGGYKENVVPESASALIDVRYLPGERQLVLDRIREAAGENVSIDLELELDAFEAPFSGDLVETVKSVISELDPGAVVLPHLIPGGTDAKSLLPLGITGYGFIPLKLPEDYAFPAMFHGVDERVPLDALVFGQRAIAAIVRRS